MPPGVLFGQFWAPASECPKECFLSAFWRFWSLKTPKSTQKAVFGALRGRCPKLPKKHSGGALSGPGPKSTPVNGGRDRKVCAHFSAPFGLSSQSPTPTEGRRCFHIWRCCCQQFGCFRFQLPSVDDSHRQVFMHHHRWREKSPRTLSPPPQHQWCISTTFLGRGEKTPPPPRFQPY